MPQTHNPAVDLLHFVFAICLIVTLIFWRECHADDPYDRDVAYIGIMSRATFFSNPTDSSIATEMIFQDVMRNIARKGVFNRYHSTEDVVREMKRHRLDAVITNVFDYLEIDHMVNPNQRYSLVIGHDLLQQVVLLTRRSDKITSLAQLKHKRLIHPSGFKLAKIFLDVELRKADLPATEQFFSSMVANTDINSVIIDLFFNKADAALVTDTSYRIASELNKQISQSLEVLIASKPIPPIVIGVNKSVPVNFTDKVDEMLANLDDYPKTVHLLSLFKADTIVKINDDDLQSAPHLKQEYEKLIERDY
ncbi:MAG: phosphate/phosphite/phosphonate ABC transporter substrate-binding protein [Candidatus Thiodiazotropha sp. (ex Ctena orbiculata)]|nr:phosphate/phosphite/phosphonate ABC transporter substrate-binding protein [Candidatus Thiodiazotropha taylori]MBT2998843.1 phosphate/phosphite/phosphonate ABC transporter substrate-binding protein [Candidatus Thiodiazotropha taylori]MBT3002178.1 phosphate/phosphite/phosphonate ABC transporter substrate-binding protein [Candidatus Thiodiazotropha taylori]MBV2107706.1 phosphate/phosphite/phosphonate ABC transporter substrate-binding protein [Candidatus Thiodiazotropha taylori]MBV2112504.1 phos